MPDPDECSGCFTLGCGNSLHGGCIYTEYNFHCPCVKCIIKVMCKSGCLEFNKFKRKEKFVNMKGKHTNEQIL